MVEQFANNASSTLASGIDNSTTSITLVDASKFSTTGTYRVVVESEIMQVTARSSNVLTVVRGSEGTIAASHGSGAFVTQIMTAAGVQQFRSDNISTGTFLSRPTAGIAGRLYRPNDGNIGYIDTGSVWSPFGPIMPLISPPAASNFTIFQTASNSTLLDDSGGLYFSALQRVTTNDRAFATQSNPGGTGAAHTLTVGFIFTPGGKNGTAGFFNYHIAGIGMYNTSTTQHRELIVYAQGDGSFRFQLGGATGLTTAGTSTFDIGGYPLLSGPMIWLKVQDDGSTNRTWSISSDGRHYKPLTIEARTTGFSAQPDKIGIHIDSFNADSQMTVLSYSLTSP
jgi:hypothetical protein